MSSQPLIIITGASSSGKSTLAHALKERFDSHYQVIGMDDYYFDRSTISNEAYAQTNMDKPSAFDIPKLLTHLKAHRDGQDFKANIYHHPTRTLRTDQHTILGHKPLVLEGIMAAYVDEIRDLASCIIYLDTPMDICLARRLLRPRSQDNKRAIYKYLKFIRPGHLEFTQPTREYADLILNGQDNETDISHLCQFLKERNI